MFGYVVSLDVNNIHTAYLDYDKSLESRELARRLEASGYFTITQRPASAGGIRELMDRERSCARYRSTGVSRRT